MASISKAVIEDRVARLAEYVRSSESSMNCGFKPCIDWWISHETDTNRKNHEGAYTFLDQIGVTTRDMVTHYGAHWVGGVGHKHFTSYIKTRKFKQTVCITILSADTEATEMAPNADNIVGGPNTRNASWVKLRDSICGTVSSLSVPADPTQVISKKRKTLKKNPKTDKIIIPVTQPTDLSSSEIKIHNYFKSTEARILFKPTDLEGDALVAINNQIKLLKDAQSTSASYHLLLPAHPSKVGEGIEYSWGCSKNKYRKEPLSKKKGKETYRELVKKCISRDDLTTERVRKFSRRARSYICAYHQMHYSDVNPDASVPEQVKIEQLAKSYKTHRSVVDFNYGFTTSDVKSTQ